MLGSVSTPTYQVSEVSSTSLAVESMLDLMLELVWPLVWEGGSTVVCCIRRLMRNLLANGEQALDAILARLEEEQEQARAWVLVLMEV